MCFGGNFTRLAEALSLYSIIKLEHNIKMSLTLQSSQENPFFWLDYADVNYILYFSNWVLWERRERIIISLSVSGVFCHQWYSRRVPLQGSDVQGWQYEESGGIREIKKAPPCQMYPNERDNGQVVDAKCIVPPVNCEKKMRKKVRKYSCCTFGLFSYKKIIPGERNVWVGWLKRNIY